MAIRGWFSAVPLARLVHIVGAAAVAGGLLYWGIRWWQIPPRSVTGLAAQRPGADPTAGIVAQWLGPGDVRLNVVVQGVMIRRQRAVALLSVNVARPAPFMAGEAIMENVSIRAINADVVILESGGKLLHISSPVSPPLPENGLVREARSR